MNEILDSINSCGLKTELSRVESSFKGTRIM